MNLSSPCLNSVVLLATILFHGCKCHTLILCCWLTPSGTDTGGSRLLISEALKVLSFIGRLCVLRWCKWLTMKTLTFHVHQEQLRSREEKACVVLCKTEPKFLLPALLLFVISFCAISNLDYNLTEQRCIGQSLSVWWGTHTWPCLNRKILTKGGKMTIFGLSGRQWIFCYPNHQSSKFLWSI